MTSFTGSELQIESLRSVVSRCSDLGEAVSNYAWWSNRLSKARREAMAHRLSYIRIMRDLWRERASELLARSEPST